MRARKYTFVEGLRNQMGKLRETFGKNLRSRRLTEEAKSVRGKSEGG